MVLIPYEKYQHMSTNTVHSGDQNKTIDDSKIINPDKTDTTIKSDVESSKIDSSSSETHNSVINSATDKDILSEVPKRLHHRMNILLHF